MTLPQIWVGMTPQRGVLVVASAQRCPYACLAPRAEPRSREYGRLVGYDVTGFSTPFVGVQWTKTARDKDIARAVVVFLEDRRVLFADRHVEDEQHCVESVLQIRAFLTEQIKQTKPGKDLEVALRHMRSACRRFLEAAGPRGREFWHHPGSGHDPFFLALGELRASFGAQLALILSQYPMRLERELASILPVEDDGEGLSWLPGVQR